MTVLRHYFISDSLDDLDLVEEELESKGITTPHMHVLSADETGIANHPHLHGVTPFMKRDVLRSGVLGAIVGIGLAVVILVVSYFAGWTASITGWVIPLFGALLVFGYSTWQGGFIGIQTKNIHFERYEEALAEGKHLFFVDLQPNFEGVLDDVVRQHPGLELAGTARGTPEWIMVGQQRIPKLLRETLP